MHQLPVLWKLIAAGWAVACLFSFLFLCGAAGKDMPWLTRKDRNKIDEPMYTPDEIDEMDKR
jgi:hypothetical protein